MRHWAGTITRAAWIGSWRAWGCRLRRWTRRRRRQAAGRRTRAALARALLTDPDLLVLDEPTNYLDFDGLNWLEEFLSGFKYAVLVVSHDRYFLDRVCSEIWEMERGRVKRFPGNYSRYRELKRAQVERQQKEFERQREYIAKEEFFIQRYKAGQRSREARGREKKLARLERIEAPQSEKTVSIGAASASRTGHIAMSLRGLSVGFSDNGSQTKLLTLPDMELESGSRTAIVGANGIGKTTLIRTILGEQPPLSGLGHPGTQRRDGIPQPGNVEPPGRQERAGGLPGNSQPSHWGSAGLPRALPVPGR